ncbi:MAG: hypothetical protein C5B49_07105 [Bdellovibrio sp.]|nr:MAG: hypothetical protein C5B49_07105 [Bdellovibrio sp.]
MAKTVVYVISDEMTGIDEVKSFCMSHGWTCYGYSPNQWRDGLENPSFRGQMMNGVPSLAAGFSPLEKSNVLPFPGVTSSNVDMSGKVATMEELESKAIENAILQFRGNLTEAAKALGIGRATLYRKVKQYQIDPSAARKRRAA